MSKAKFTPGPWVLKPEECDRPYIRVRGDRCGVRHKIANVLTPVYEGVDERAANETRANARLIAAAPEMFAILGWLEKLLAEECYRGGNPQHPAYPRWLEICAVLSKINATEV